MSQTGKCNSVHLGPGLATTHCQMCCLLPWDVPLGINGNTPKSKVTHIHKYLWNQALKFAFLVLSWLCCVTLANHLTYLCLSFPISEMKQVILNSLIGKLWDFIMAVKNLDARYYMEDKVLILLLQSYFISHVSDQKK